jgi:pyridoxal phosphate enzyme (YggS family)
MALGLTRFGENRVQDAAAKLATLPDARWEMVGRLQSNKAARALEIFDVIHSIDSVALAERIDRLSAQTRRTPYPVYLQVNVDEDEAKAGFAPDALHAAARDIASLGHLEVRGLMTVGRLVATPELARPSFRALRELSAQLHSTDARIAAGLSMGMSDDFEIAVEEGATVVRLGRVLFGERLSA